MEVYVWMASIRTRVNAKKITSAKTVKQVSSHSFIMATYFSPMPSSNVVIEFVVTVAFSVLL